MYKDNHENCAIILSSTFGEDEECILSYLKHVEFICKSVKNQYSVLPVLVFEKSEKNKKDSIKNKVISEKMDILPILLINNDGQGFASCLNFGIKKTNSKYIFRLDTDDRTNPRRIIDQIEIMNTKDFDMSCGYMEDQNNKILRYPKNIKTMSLMLSLGTNPIAHPSVCIKRESLYLLYDESLNRCEDFDFWLRLLISNSIKIKVFTKPLTKYNTLRSMEKDKENALSQIKIRLKYISKLFLIIISLTLGLIPNFLRFIFARNIMLLLRRKL